MIQQSEIAAVELRIDWEQDGAGHRNRQYFARTNLWRDILPGALSLQLPESHGEWIAEHFAPGEVVPPWSEDNIHRVQRDGLRLQRRNGPPVALFRGRHYPRYIAAGTAGIHPGDIRPLRLLELDVHTATLDLNHPLARSALTVAARVDHRLGPANEHGGRCTDLLMDALAGGPGLEALHAAGSTDYFSDDPFARMDPRDDAQYYRQPRLVQHLDRCVREQISELYGRFLQPGMQVLDLMASWVSHLPEQPAGLRVTGLGMNEQELAANPRLQQRVVHDLNLEPRLPFATAAFDAVLCTASAEYLVRPVEVIRELARVLKPGAPAVITFSDRCFPDKSIALWTNLHPFERLALVQEYFRAAGDFGLTATETARGWPRPEDDKYAGRLADADPLFALWSVRNG